MAKLEQIRRVRLPYRRIDLSHNHGENLTLFTNIQIFCGCIRITTLHVASPLAVGISFPNSLKMKEEKVAPAALAQESYLLEELPFPL